MRDLIGREEAILAILDTESKVARETHYDSEVFSVMAKRQNEILDVLFALPSADRPTGEWISEELAKMICDEICYYKEVVVNADSLDDLCEGCLIKKMKHGRPTGRWVPVTNGRGGHECDQCHNYAPSWATGEERLTKFCPNCGCRMEGGEEE